MPNQDKDKGLNRGGSLGQEDELGEKSVNVNQPNQPGQQRGMPGGQQPGRDIKPGQKPGQPNVKPGQPSVKPGQPNLKPGQGNIDKPGEQRGGLRREPNLEGAEKDSGHEVD